jgi:hypothetical protein
MGIPHISADVCLLPQMSAGQRAAADEDATSMQMK